ncbi:MAG TPA: hypothetical protein VE727_02885 [Solirubrobacterales bacterium]|nr:hypothetical protein [Solirubrobacterales bacterium]
MRLKGALAAAALCAALGFEGCGGESKSPLDDALGVLPANAPLAIAVSTDLDSASYRDLDAALQRFGVEGGLEGSLEEGVGGYGGISFARDIRPLLGNELVVGIPSFAGGVEGEAAAAPPEVAAIRVTDGDAARDLLNDLGLEEVDEVEGATVYGTPSPEEGPEGSESGGPRVGVDGDLVVAAGSQRGLEEALRQRGEDDRLTEGLFSERLAGLPEEAIVRAAGDVPSVLESLGIEETAAVPWVKSLHSYGIVANVNGRTATVDASLSGDEVAQNDLPLDPGPSSPRVLEDEPTVATRDQAQSIEFALAAVRSVVPQAAFDEVTGRLRRRLRGSVATLIDQFGEGLVARLGDDVTATRSVVEDPATVSKALAALHDEVPLLVRLGGSSDAVREALQAARYVIPALPVAEPESFPPGAKVIRVPGSPDLYRLVTPVPRVLAPARRRPGLRVAPQPRFTRPQLVFGLIDGVFVTAPSLTAARQIREAEPVHAGLPPGALAFRIPVKASDLGIPEIAGIGLTLTTIEGGIEAKTTGLRLQAQAGL